MLRDRFVLTEQGYKDFKRGVFSCTLANLMLMLPIVVLYMVAKDFIGHLADPAAPLPELLPYAIGIVVVLAVMFVTQYWEYNATYCVVYDESARRRTALAERLRMLPLSFFGNRDLADLTMVIMKDTADQERMFSHVMPQLFGMGLSSLVFAVMMLAFDWRYGVAALWPISIAVVVLLLCGKMQQRASSRKNAESLGLNDGIQEFLDCHREIRSLNLVGAHIESLDGRIGAFEKAKIKAELVAGVPVSLCQAFLRLGVASTIVVGTALLISGTSDLVTFFCFMLVVTRFYDPINTILQTIAELIDMLLSLDRMRAVESEPLQTGAKEFSPQGHDLVFENVGFSYKTGERVLDGVSFTAKEGEVTALVGASGSGKSTVVKLASRFWDADEGSVKVGGMDVSTVDPETLFTDYSEVFQDVVLFDNTVMENIRIGNMDASDDEVLAAANAANCDEFVDKLPDGYDTMVGENGSRLSGGERQRISIARAILKDAPIVLLDEATASLDVENESRVQRALSRLLAGKTVLVIAHRMRTVDNADKIVVLDCGHVVEQGAPADLRAIEGGAYRRMLELQRQSSAWAV